jgi:hypothetical protein
VCDLALPTTIMDFIEYHVENARQFWAELEDILHIPSTASLNRIDSALRAFIKFCSSYHGLSLICSLIFGWFC